MQMTKESSLPHGKRLHFIDTLRGITIVSMVAYHFTWDLVFLFQKEISWMGSSISYAWQQSICWSFILLSGFCLSFSRHPLRRGWQVFAIGAIITIITTLFMPDERIIFGILTFLGSAMIITSLISPFLDRIPALWGSLASFILFLLLKGMNKRVLGFAIWKITLSDFLYKNYISTYLGFPFRGFFSTDYFSLLPWIFLFMTGYYLHAFFEEFQIYDKIPSWREPVFSFLGRHSLLIYVIHQPLLYGLSILWIQLKQFFL